MPKSKPLKKRRTSKKSIKEANPGRSCARHQSSHWIVRELCWAGNLWKSFFSLRIVKITLAVLLVVIVIPVVSFLILRPKPAEEIKWGITFSPRYAEEIGLDWQDTYIKILDDLGVQNLRLVAYWDEVEPQNDLYTYERIKWQLNEAQKRDVDVILTMGYKVPRWPECFAPDWWNTMENEELKRIELFEYVERTTLELKGYNNIKKWQVENEPFFPFGICEPILEENVREEVRIVRLADEYDRPIVIQDSGEGGFWKPTYEMADYLAISMYRRIWFDFWKVFLGKSVYFQYPLAHWTYKIKAAITGIPPKKIIVTELQGEPWGPTINSELTEEQKNKTMSRTHFLSTLAYASKSGFDEIYVWGAEWWLWEKEQNDNPYYWDTAKGVFAN